MGLLTELREAKIIAIIRGLEGKEIDLTADALAAGGIRFIEVTLNSPDAIHTLTRWNKKYAGNQLQIGAGTVLNIEMAKQAIEVGASYLITPHVDQQLISFAVKQGVEVWSGAFTPTEIYTAYQSGASAVKVFPAATLGVDYFKAIRGPLNQIPLIAVGGVRIQQIPSFFAAGVMAVGLGDHLIDRQLIREGRFDALTARASQFVQAVNTESSNA